MVIQLLMQLMLLLLLLWLAGASSASLAKDGCQDTCGSVPIPFPFGIGANCAANGNFAITCNNSSNPPKPYFTSNNLEVLNISLSGTVVVLHPVLASVCPNGRTNDHHVVFLTDPFSFSETDNRFTAIGCNNLALMTIQQETRIGGCLLLLCNVTERNQSCNGINCCQTTIPASLNFINASFSSINDSRTDIDCNYAFIVEQEWFHNLSDPHIMQQMEAVPAVLDWSAHGQCESFDKLSAPANNNSWSGMLCYENATCRWPTGSAGYGCYCDRRYEGNPYLPPGCKPIDYCARRPENCEICQNLPNGSGYSCRSKVESSNSKRARNIIIGISTSFGTLLLLIVTWLLFRLVRRRRKLMLKEKFFKRNGGMLLKQQLSSGDQGNVEKNKLFTSKELEKATDRFNENRIIGQGGQGTVYKGMLTDGRIVAVKKSKRVDEGKLEQFINEVVILSQINHRNVVKLHGCCLEAEVPLLVYEFIPNGTLYQYIHEQNEMFPLTWNTRVRIAVEVSGALTYLHSAASIPIYHRDIKSTNILLDEKFRAKVSDFGTSKSVAIDQTHLTTRVQGTFGYLDPEYFQSSQFTEKSDVYSFGVVLVELLTGQKPISSTMSEEWRSLATYFMLTMKENRLFDILDARVFKEGGKKEIMRVANLAKRCLNLSGRKRPTMKEVAIELEGIRMSHGISTIQQNYEEVEYAVNEPTGPWDDSSTSMESYLDSRASSSRYVQPRDVQPLLFK